jgi:diamine N-acetyltransferase
MTIAIRKANAEDAGIIALLGRLTFRETFGPLFDGREGELQTYLDHIFSVAKIAASIAKPQNHYWLALMDTLPVGYAKQKYSSPNVLIDAPAPAQLQKIYVLSEFIAHRIGHELLETIMESSRASEIMVMWLTVLNTNDRAIRFYERHGWTDAGTTSFTIGTQTFSFIAMKRTM